MRGDARQQLPEDVVLLDDADIEGVGLKNSSPVPFGV
jgi:hypothetical protein